MKKIWVWLLLQCIACGLVSAEFSQPMLLTEITAGYRRDNFEWKIKTPERDGCDLADDRHHHDNEHQHERKHKREKEHTLFEQNWTSLQIFEVTGRASLATCNNYYVRVNGGWGKIFQGEQRSSAWERLPLHHEYRHERCETSRIKGDANHGHVIDFDGGVGYQFTSNGSLCVATPLVGWSYHSQNFKGSDNKQVINRLDSPPIYGEINNLNIHYQPKWFGPWIGADFLVSVDTPCNKLFGSIEYHWVQFHAKGKWHLDPQFATDFSQNGHGRGLVAYLGFTHRIACGWNVGIIGYYRNWQVNNGKHKTSSVYVDPEYEDVNFGTMPVVPLKSHSDIQKARWNSWSVAISLDYMLYD